MYSFDDRNGDNLESAPEGTAGCVRAADQHGLFFNQQQRLWYQGPMFRHEATAEGALSTVSTIWCRGIWYGGAGHRRRSYSAFGARSGKTCS